MRFDFDEVDNIQETEYCCMPCFTEDVLETLVNLDEYEPVSIYAKADLLTDMLRVLLTSTVDDEPLTLGMFDLDGMGCDYDQEYVMSINDDLTIWCEPAFRLKDGKWELFDNDSVVNFVHGDCNSKILRKLTKEEQNVIIFDFEEE